MYDLIGAIRDKYPGKIEALRKKLDLGPKTDKRANLELETFIKQLHLYNEKLRAGEKITFGEFLQIQKQDNS